MSARLRIAVLMSPCIIVVALVLPLLHAPAPILAQQEPSPVYLPLVFSGEVTAADETTETPTTGTPPVSPVLGQPTGVCAENAPVGSELNGPALWMPYPIEDKVVIIPAGEAATVCVWMVLDGQPVEGAEVVGTGFYQMYSIDYSFLFDLDPQTTAANGIAILTFANYGYGFGSVEVEVRYNGITYTDDDGYALSSNYDMPPSQ
jgi:hypothetical protein